MHVCESISTKNPSCVISCGAVGGVGWGGGGCGVGGGGGPSLSRHPPPYSQSSPRVYTIHIPILPYVRTDCKRKGEGKEGRGKGGREGGEGEEKGKTGEKRGVIVTKVCFCELST